jgi:hypothetical protein
MAATSSRVIAAAFDIQCVYRPELKQATLVLTVTDTTPSIIDAILADPRTDHGSGAATSTAAFVDMAEAAGTTVKSKHLWSATGPVARGAVW